MCEFKCFRPSDLKVHLAEVHNIGDVNWHSCHMCEFKCKRRDNLKSHLAYAHDIGVNWHSCHMCEFKCKQRCNLKSHLAFKHNIGVELFHCDICKSKFKESCGLKQHLAKKHNIDVERFSWSRRARRLQAPAAPRLQRRQEPRPQRRQELQRPRSGRIETEPMPRGDVPEDVWQEAKEMMADGRLPTMTSDQRQRWCAWGFKTGSWLGVPPGQCDAALMQTLRILEEGSWCQEEGQTQEARQAQEVTHDMRDTSHARVGWHRKR